MPVLKPEPRMLTVWRILLVAAAIPVAFLCSLILRQQLGMWLLVSAVWLLLFLICYLFYLPARYEGYAFKLTEGAVVLYRGVFVRKSSMLPVGSIQYTNIVSYPVQRIFGLCSLRIVAPGASMVIPGLPLRDAGDITNILNGQR